MIGDTLGSYQILLPPDHLGAVDAQHAGVSVAGPGVG